MKKSQNLTLILLTATALLTSSAFAQTSPTSGSTQTPAAKLPASSGTAAAKSQSSTGTAAKKPGSATTAKPAAAPLALKTNREKASYAFGANLARNLKKEGIELDSSILARGFKDGFGDGKLLISDQDAQAALMAYAEEVKKKREVQLAAEGAVNQKAGEAYLAANKAKPGVVTLPSGLQYKIVSPGTGPKPNTGDTIICNYRGALISGKEFDSSATHGGPQPIPVGGVIKGWTEALQLMPVGSKWQLFIPADLAYGQRSPGPEIGPNSTLVFDVELLSIQEKPKEGPQDPAKGAAPTGPNAPNTAPTTPQPQAAPQAAPPPAPKPPSL